MREVDVVYRPEAIDDLEQIYRFVLDLSFTPEVAQAYVLRIREHCRRIGLVPRGGNPRDDLEPGLRTMSFERRAVIAYRLTEARVEIVNVFYGGRDFEAMYRNRNPDPEIPDGAD